MDKAEGLNGSDACRSFAYNREMDTKDLTALAAEERLALIAALWESLCDEAPSPAAQAAELESRLRSFDQERNAAAAWDAIKSELARR